jgi:radical SAM superfamily enzyme YgiQ (UPF0313 family)
MRAKNKQLLLINPWIYDFTAYDLWSKPIGLLYLASFLANQGFIISLVDCLDNQLIKPKKYGQGKYQRQIIEKPAILKHIPRQYARYGVSEESFLAKLKETAAPDAILVTSMMTYWYPGPMHVVALLRKIFPGVPIILGGIYASLLPDHAQEKVQPDYIIRGPGEIAVLKLLAQIFDIPFDSFELPETLDDFPYPAFYLLENIRYLAIMTSRGCPYNCPFCAQSLIAMPFTQRKPFQVVAEIETHYHKYRARDFAFYDDALFLNSNRHIKPILHALVKLQLPLRFHTPNGLFTGQIDAELARLLFQANFRTIRLSYETINAQRQQEMSHKVTNESMTAAVDNLQLAGYQKKELEAYVIMGLPDQPPEEVLESMIFINRLGLQIHLASYSPIAGTRDFARAVSAGLIDQNIDPLLTNKTIFPLQPPDAYQTYRNLRLLQILFNQAAYHSYSPFSDRYFLSVIKKLRY